MKIEDIRKKSEAHKKEAYAQKCMKDRDDTGAIKRGSVIEFWGGYSDDIRYRAEVAGVVDGSIYLVWDCYWFPIKDEKRRAIKLVA